MHFLTLLLCGFTFFSPIVGVHAQDMEESMEATILTVTPISCAREPEATCAELTVQVTRGSKKGQTLTFKANAKEMPGGEHITFAEGQRLVLTSGIVNGQERIQVSDLVRRPSLTLIFGLFCAAVFLLSGFSGLRSIVGMCMSIGVLFFFILPRILAGDSPVVVSLIGSAMVMTLTLLIGHGWNAKSFTALGGTILSLIVTGILAKVFTVWTHVFGLASEEAVFLLTDIPTLDTRGLLLAGIIIGALGTLDDVTISQASAVFELRRANPALSARDLYRRAIRIGHDHVSAAVNTLVLAYAGAALPLLLLITQNAHHESWLILLNRETFAAEIVRTFAGSIGLIAAVPFTTLLASFLAVRLSQRQLEHGHTHQ
jgi:uncharacterized membrane protein